MRYHMKTQHTKEIKYDQTVARKHENTQVFKIDKEKTNEGKT